MRFRVVIDLDNVLNNLNEWMIQVFNERYDDNISEDLFTEYDFHKCLPFDKAEKYCALCCEEEVVNSLAPTKNSQWAVKYFVNKGYDVYIVTATNAKTLYLKEQWLQSLFPFVEKSRIICAQDKSIIHADVMIDDKIENLISNIYCDRVCLDRPWNKNVYDDVYGIHRCEGWEEIVEVVDELYTDMINANKEG